MTQISQKNCIYAVEHIAKGEEKMKSKYFEAGNIYLATYLVFCGFTMRGLSGSGRAKRVLFDDTPEVRSASDNFFNDSETQRIFNCYRRVKDYIFQNGV
jgi:hypothetical protein